MMILLMLGMICFISMSDGAVSLVIMMSFMKVLLTFPPFSENFIYHETSIQIDQIMIILNMLTLLIYFFMVLGSKENRVFKKNHNFITLLMILLIMLAFSVHSYLSFYLFFEISLIPMFLLVLGWGYQPERLNAGVNLLFYTITSSMPLLLVVLSVVSKKSHPKMGMILDFSLSLDNLLLNWMTWAILISMMVKFPMFGVHLWLPKAHVEAPVEGSMFLAAIMLKLAGYGTIRFMPLLGVNSTLYCLQSLSMVGGAIVSFICLRQNDMKTMIAYSSVAHMSFVIFSLSSKSLLGVQAAILMMIAHGVSSSGLFFGANLFYSNFHTRNMALIKGSLTFIPLVLFSWFMLCVSNFGGPPTINLMAEIFSIIVSINSNTILMVPIIGLTFLAAAYSLLLYANLSQGIFSEFTKSVNQFIFREILTLVLHSMYLVLLFFWFI